MDVEDSFVTINLDSQECEICHEDTGETLESCHFCLGLGTLKSVKEGFNKVTHVNTKAHTSCFARNHEVGCHSSHNNDIAKTSNMCQHTGVCAHRDNNVLQHSKEMINDKIQCLTRLSWKSKWSQKVLQLQHECNNLYNNSIPCCSTTNELRNAKRYDSNAMERVKQHAELTATPYTDSAAALQDSYIKYLFGGKIPNEWNINEKYACKKTEPSVFSSSVFYEQRDEVRYSTQRTAFKLGNDEPFNQRFLGHVVEFEADKQDCDQIRREDKEDCKASAVMSLCELEDTEVNNCHNVYKSVVSSPGNQDESMMPKLENGVETQQTFQVYSEKQLQKCSCTDIMQIVSEMSARVEDASCQLVKILQARDSLCHEISVRHATIAKLLKIKQQNVQEKQL